MGGRRFVTIGGSSAAGGACTADSQGNTRELLAEADFALYRAKDLGQDRLAMFDKNLRTTAVERLVTEGMLRHALSDGRVVVEYQPIVDIRSGQPLGAESLVRIRDRDHGLRLPGSFLGVAEGTGMLVATDEVVLADVLTQAASWRAHLGDEFGGVAINVTARHLARLRFPPAGPPLVESQRRTPRRPVHRGR